MSTTHVNPSDAPQDPGDRQYHIGLAPGEVTDRILLVGDPGRVGKGADLLESPSPIRTHREYASTTGTWAGKRVSILGTGIGTDNTEIAVVELSRLVDPARSVLIRVGSSGAISEPVGAGDLVVSTGAVRLESTSLAYVDPGFPAIAHHEVVAALLAACRRAGHRHHVGLTASACGFFGAQGRPVEGLPLRWPDRVDRLAAQRVLNMEMECSTLFTLATLFGMRAGAVCAVFADRSTGRFLDAPARGEAEVRALGVALEALASL
jgi:uridine phosphorylase